ncbi:MAG: chemotaxis protein [Planctomycetes bacterium]|nr:chemotaxis protein [Planctomycetota bacterium]
MFKDLSLKLKIMLGSCLPLVLVVILGYICYSSIGSLLQSSNSVDHTHVVIETAQKIEGAAVDMETGMRGYLLAGQDGFLEPYTNGKSRFATLVSELKNTVNDNPAQVQLLSETQDNINAWVKDIVEPTLDLRRQIGTAKTMDDMADLIGQAKGKQYFDKFREQIATFVSREETLTTERQKSAAEATAKNVEYNKQIAQTTTWVEHTYQVISKAKAIEAAAVDMETGMRGYLLAGTDTFLDPYNNGKSTFSEVVSALSVTVNDNPQQVTLLEEIKNNIGEWNSKVTEPAIALRAQVGTDANAKSMDDVAAWVGQANGKQYFDKFRGQIATFISREETLLGERQQEAKDATTARDKGSELIAQTSKQVEHTHTVISEAKKIEAAAVDMETGARGYFLAGKDSFLAPYAQGKAQFSGRVSGLSTTVNDNPAQVKLLGEIASNMKAWQDIVIQPTIDLRGQIGDAQTMNDMASLVGEARGKEYFDKFRGQVATFIERESTLMAQRQEAAKKTAKRATGVIVGGTSVTVLIALIVSFCLTGSIIKPFKNIFAGLKTFSGRELNELGRTFLDIIESLSSGGSQVAQASQSLAEGATEQAAGLEETSSSLEEMSSMTKQNADNAQQANTLAADARKAANNGAESMSRMNTAIEKIQKSSEETSKIIKVIDEIAFQTNLLALNAAVEAARAGEAGKGFAVVAEEVRNLAMRSAEAAKNTSNMIEESVKNAGNGVDIANEVGKVLDEIVQGVGKTTDLVGEIAAASQEQAQGIDQVNTAVNQMDKVTQQNAASAEESASASEQIMSIMGNLQQLVQGSSAGASTVAGRPGLNVTDDAFHQIAGGTKKEASLKVPVGAAAIPLDDDSLGFDDFNS